MSIGLDHNNKPILIIDDNPADREMFRHIIETSHGRYCPDFLEADSCESALDILNQHEPYCCIVDYQLPGLSGLDFLRKLRLTEKGKTVPVVIITGEGDERLAVDMLQNGAQDYLVKSAINAERLIYSINNAVHTLKLQTKISYLAHYDSLTGLLNRSLFLDRLQNAINHCDRYRTSCSVLLIDINKFREINTRFGHEAGDEVLVTVARRIHVLCRNTDSAGRFGNDSFTVLLDEIDKTNTNLTAAKILTAVNKPIDVGGEKITISASIGIAYYPHTAANANELMQQVDETLYLVKKSGENNLSCFTVEQKKNWQRKLDLEALLPSALKNNELFIVYQPIVNGSDKSLYGLEALVRWEPEGHSINALEVVQLIDQLNLFDAFHVWLIDTALKQFNSWQKTSTDLQLSLNIPIKYSHSHLIISCLRKAIAAYNIKPKQIVFEVTEQTLMEHPSLSLELLNGLKKEGVSIAIDDFGSGYSSMAHLTKLPIDTLKIDQQFFIDQHGDSHRKTITAIVALGHSLGLNIIAEGVNSATQYDMATDIGCDYIQGYHFGEPRQAADNWQEFLKHFTAIEKPKKSPF